MSPSRLLRIFALTLMAPLLTALSCSLFEEAGIQRFKRHWFAATQQYAAAQRDMSANGCSLILIGAPGGCDFATLSAAQQSAVRAGFNQLAAACRDIASLTSSAGAIYQRAKGYAGAEDVVSDVGPYRPNGPAGSLALSFCRQSMAAYQRADPDGYQAALEGARQDAQSGGAPDSNVDREPRQPSGGGSPGAAGGYTPPGGGGGGGGPPPGGGGE